MGLERWVHLATPVCKYHYLLPLSGTYIGHLRPLDIGATLWPAPEMQMQSIQITPVSQVEIPNQSKAKSSVLHLPWRSHSTFHQSLKATGFPPHHSSVRFLVS